MVCNAAIENLMLYKSLSYSQKHFPITENFSEARKSIKLEKVIKSLIDAIQINAFQKILCLSLKYIYI